ncbi:hypothetical protein K435DRAFT_838617 [Dendrothele bispora CBS 962.96]|uniref:Protein kinase domain-containing protein n=1 Tax=Dendrothele bispora (strain CBS 962.96) TaxID=1314807 RepID=A0A4S8M5W6_DENBC|nr:hypothetical protein K435DRAFT_838617 [Dendrothele bispora CBS 962.96]
MKSLQGRDIPMSYGFHKVLVSYCGEEYESCFVHILQFVPLPTLTSIPLPLTDDTVSSLLDSFIPSLYRIHQCGIAHHDLSPCNLLVRIENNDSQSQVPIISKVLFIDFAMSVKTDVKSVKSDANSVVGVLSLLDVDDPQGSVLRWYEQHLEEPCAAMFTNVHLKARPKTGRQIGIYPEATKNFRDIIYSGNRWARPQLDQQYQSVE